MQQYWMRRRTPKQRVPRLISAPWQTMRLEDDVVLLQLLFLRAPKVVFRTGLSRPRTTLWLGGASVKLDVILLQRHHGWRALLELDGDLAGGDDHRAIALVMVYHLSNFGEVSWRRHGTKRLLRAAGI